MRTLWNRREFGAVLVAAPAAQRLPGDQFGPSGSAASFTAIAVAGDCASLVAFSPGLRPAWKKAFDQNRPFVQLGALMPDPDRLLPELLRADTPESLSLAAGAMFVKAAQELNAAVPESCRAWQDVAILKEICGTSGKVSKDQLLELLRAMGTRRMIELHTLIPDSSGVSGWLERLFAWEQKQDEMFRAIAAAWDSEPAGMRELKRINFYNPSDAVIRLARDIGMGRVIEASAIGKAAAEADRGSLYAKALGSGYRQMKTTGAF